MNNIDLSSFNDITIDDREILNKIIQENNKVLCDFNFSNLYMWAEIFKIRWSMHKERLLLYSGLSDRLFMPVGEDFESSEIVQISDSFRAQGKSGNLMFFEPDYIEKNRELSNHFRIEIDLDTADYIYFSKKLFELKGKKLHKKKNLISQFLRNNPGYIVKKMEKEFFEKCFVLSDKWCKYKNCDKIGFTHENSALKRAFDKFSELELGGLTVFLKDKLAAFSIFSRQNKNMADVNFEKYDPEIKGCEQVICWETAKYLMQDYEYLNREEDLGVEGLRQSKKSYEPAYLHSTYKLLRKS